MSLLQEISWISLSPFAAMWSGIVLGGSFFAFPLFRLYMRSRKKAAVLKNDLRLFKLVLDASHEPMCWWQNSSEPISCTQGVIELLGLNSNQPIFILDVVNQFYAEDAHKIDSHLAKLSQDRESFTTVVSLIDEKTIIQITGAQFCDQGMSQIILNFRDVTTTETHFARLRAKFEDLDRSEQRLQQVINLIPVAAWCRDAQQQLTYCNEIYAGIIDSSLEKAVQNNLELIDKQRSVSPYQLAVKAQQQQVAQVRRTHLVIDGHRRMVEICELPLQQIGESVGYALDLTDIEESAAELANHIAAHQEVLHHLSTPVAVYSADTRLEFFNHAYLKLFQFEEKWLYQKPTYAEVLQDLRERRKLPEYSDFVDYRRSQLQLFNTLIHPVHELIHQPDGQILRMMIVPHPLGGLLFMFDDVTDKLALERRYNTLIAVQKETIDNLYEGIVVLGSDSRLRLSNPAAASIWGMAALELMPGRHAAEILKEIRNAFHGYNAWDEFRHRLLNLFNERKATTDRVNLIGDTIIQYSYVPLPDGSHLVSFVDISDRWRFEQALRERNEALEQADRIKSDFISHISYELRSPLNTIIGFSEILQNQYFGQLNERQSDYCRGIYDSSQRLLSLINDIIDFASIEAGQLNLKIEQINLESFLSSLVALVYNRSNDQGLEIIYTNKATINHFFADERRLKQAVFNLLMNAIKFTPSGGRIELVAEVIDNDNGIELCLAVVDTGVGMDENDQAQFIRLFEGKGNIAAGDHSNSATPGIGLSLVKSFIGLHGGHVVLESKRGKGTTVKCYIPLVLERYNDQSLIEFGAIRA